MAEDYLQSMLAGESRAYGFTIAFWGSGALLINQFGAPNLIQALSYGSGAILGFGVLALSLLRGDRESASGDQTLLALSTVHYLSALAPIIFTHLAIQTGLPVEVKFLLGGMAVSLLYNLLSVIEKDIAELFSN
jgi:hypothetical protein